MNMIDFNLMIDELRNKKKTVKHDSIYNELKRGKEQLQLMRNEKMSLQEMHNWLVNTKNEAIMIKVAGKNKKTKPISLSVFSKYVKDILNEPPREKYDENILLNILSQSPLSELLTIEKLSKEQAKALYQYLIGKNVNKTHIARFIKLRK